MSAKADTLKLAHDIYRITGDRDRHHDEADVFTWLASGDGSLGETVQELAEQFLEYLAEDEDIDAEMNSNYYRDVMPRNVR
jgi:hypothetical protein